MLFLSVIAVYIYIVQGFFCFRYILPCFAVLDLKEGEKNLISVFKYLYTILIIYIVLIVGFELDRNLMTCT